MPNVFAGQAMFGSSTTHSVTSTSQVPIFPMSITQINKERPQVSSTASVFSEIASASLRKECGLVKQDSTCNESNGMCI